MQAYLAPVIDGTPIPDVFRIGVRHTTPSNCVNLATHDSAETHHTHVHRDDSKLQHKHELESNKLATLGHAPVATAASRVHSTTFQAAEGVATSATTSLGHQPPARS